MNERYRKPVVFALIAAGGLVFSATLMGFAGKVWWVFDLFSHFRLQYFLSALAVTILLAGFRSFRVAAGFALCVAINLACIIPHYVGGVDEGSGGAFSLRMATINVNNPSQRYDLVREFIFESAPDVLLLIEIDNRWAVAMEELHALYPYRKLEPREGFFGIALYSKIPLTACEVIRFGEAALPSIVAKIEHEGKLLTLVGTHAHPPVSGARARLRNNHLEALAGYMGSLPGPKLVLGDLNISPWSAYFNGLLERSGLVMGSKGQGIKATWPADSPFFLIPIDFCLVSGELLVKSYTVGRNVGSDHYPIVVELGLKE
jgi:endonuclease/exonuclease/phosphatase (EEP) superfamily protein YafD